MNTARASYFNDLSGSEIAMIYYALWHIYRHGKSLTDEDRQKIKDLYNKLRGEEIL